MVASVNTLQGLLQRVQPAAPRSALRLQVADAPLLGANALAFPDGTIVLTVPGMLNAITPPQLQMHLETLSRAGILASSTVGAPGTHGALVAGKQGMGVRTPSAAAVAAATIGLAGELHTPNGMILTIGA